MTRRLTHIEERYSATHMHFVRQWQIYRIADLTASIGDTYRQGETQ